MATDQKASAYLRKHGPARDYVLLSEAQAERIEVLEKALHDLIEAWRNSDPVAGHEAIGNATSVLHQDE